MIRMRARFHPRGWVLLIPMAMALAGCGGDSNGGRSGTFYGAVAGSFSGPNGSFNMGRSFVTLRNDVPVAMGFELSPEAVEKQPPTEITDEFPNVYFIPLPPEAGNTAFRAMAVFYFTGHPIDQFRPVGEPPHFHTVFLVNPPQAPTENFVLELKTPAPAEIPPGISRGVPDVVVPGVGVSYDNPIKPEGQPARITIGHNYLYFNGHMNGMVVGENVTFLQSHATWTDVIPQPELYARSGYWPQRVRIWWNPERNAHVFQVEDFVFVPPSKAL